MKNDRHAIKWIYSQFAYIIWGFVALLVIGISISICLVTLALVSKRVVDIATKVSDGNFAGEVGFLAFLIILLLLFQVLHSKLNVRITGKLNISMRKKIFQNLLLKDYTSVSSYHSGELLNRINSDISVITGFIVGVAPNSIAFFARIVLIIISIYTLDPVLAVICVVLAPIVFFSSQVYRKKIKGLHKKCQETDGRSRSFMQECLQNLLVIKSFGNEKLINSHSVELQNENLKYNIKRNNISIHVNILFFVAVNIGYYFVIAWGAYKLSRGQITYGALLAILQLISQLQTPYRSITSVFPQYFAMVASGERIMELVNLPDERELYSGVAQCGLIYENMEEIVLDNVSFSYDKSKILNETGLTIKKGEFVAVCGSSGIGKSTLLKLLLGIISPTNGGVYIKTNGKEDICGNLCNNSFGEGVPSDIIPIDRNTRCIFAYVPQGNMILSGTIRDNIAFASGRYDDEEIIKCARIAQIWDFIDSLPDKLDTVLGEKGLGLSEGQVQRIAIARALYHDAPVILLDEATSGLDENTEASLLNSIKTLKEKTCVIVSHRKAAFEICNSVYCINNGKFELLTNK